MASLNSIHHTARCGSTLLVSLLSSAAPAYAEPPWAIDLLNEGACVPSARDGAIVKFQSFSLFYQIPHGKNVFVYRPLAQHIAKYRTLPAEWLSPRLARINDYINDLDVNGSTQAFAAFWARQVELALKANCKMIDSNSLFNTPMATASEVLEFFDINGQPDQRFIGVDVKSLKLIGQTDPIVFPLRRPPLRVAKGYGVFSTEAAMRNDAIRSAVEWVEDCFPQVAAFTR